MPQSFRERLLKDGEEHMKKVEASLYSRTGNLGLTHLVEEGGSNE